MCTYKYLDKKMVEVSHIVLCESPSRTLVRVGARASKRNGTKTGPHVVTSNVLCTLRVAQQEASRRTVPRVDAVQRVSRKHR